MRVSIITICFNCVKTIEETIQSVLIQNYPNIEHIVVDGKSTDGTVEIIESFGEKITKFISEKDDGIYDALNKGLNLAMGDVIGFVHGGDELIDETSVSLVVEAFKQQGTEVIYGDVLCVAPNNRDKVIRNWRAGVYNRENFRKGWMPPHLSCFMKKELYDKYGHFTTSLSIAADYELMLRFLYKYKASAAHLPEMIIRYRLGGTSNGSLINILKSNYQAYKSWGMNGYSISPLIMLRKPLSKIPQFFQK